MTIKVYAAGGSIDKAYSTKESAFVVGPPAVTTILEEANVTVEYEIESVIQKDSLDMTDHDRATLAERVERDSCSHIVITHGTDTMVATARALLGIPGKTIVLTGAMQPAAFRESDAHFNVGAAFLAAQVLPPGTYLAMNGRIFDPTQTAKNMDLDRFEQQEEGSPDF